MRSRTHRGLTLVQVPASLPGWDEMTDLDRGAALIHASKRYREPADYAVTEYATQYLDAPELVSLPAVIACQHAMQVTGGHELAVDRLGWTEHQRMYQLADTEQTARTLASLQLPVTPEPPSGYVNEPLF